MDAERVKGRQKEGTSVAREIGAWWQWEIDGDGSSTEQWMVPLIKGRERERERERENCEGLILKNEPVIVNM